MSVSKTTFPLGDVFHDVDTKCYLYNKKIADSMGIYPHRIPENKKLTAIKIYANSSINLNRASAIKALASNDKNRFIRTGSWTLRRASSFSRDQVTRWFNVHSILYSLNTHIGFAVKRRYKELDLR